MTSRLTSGQIKAKARQLGFDACGVAAADAFPELALYREWIARGYAASMGYLERTAALRADVRFVLPSAASVIATATLYNTDRPYSTECADPSRAHVARYAWGDDYHDVIGARLGALLAWMRQVSPEPFEARAYVDTGPVQERVYAARAGIGWIGKNTCLINPEIGSWVFLAEIVCSLALEIDTPAFDQCGTCALCLEACPTGALVAPGVLDSRRCISYLTIEHRGEIPAQLRGEIGRHVYGCDICQEVCPWNAMAPTSEDSSWQPRPVWDLPRLVDLLHMTDDDLRATLRGSPIKRAKIEGLRRNISIAVEHGETAHEVGGRADSGSADAEEHA